MTGVQRVHFMNALLDRDRFTKTRQLGTTIFTLCIRQLLMGPLRAVVVDLPSLAKHLQRTQQETKDLVAKYEYGGVPAGWERRAAAAEPRPLFARAHINADLKAMADAIHTIVAKQPLRCGKSPAHRLPSLGAAHRCPTD